jgi:hypothetical protein
MPYSETLDSRLSRVVSAWKTTRKKMFGGTCHILNGNMMCGVYKDFLILRLGEQQAAEALREPQVKPFDITGRPMKGWVMIGEKDLTDRALASWITRAHGFAETLPPK